MSCFKLNQDLGFSLGNNHLLIVSVVIHCINDDSPTETTKTSLTKANWTEILISCKPPYRGFLSVFLAFILKVCKVKSPNLKVVYVFQYREEEVGFPLHSHSEFHAPKRFLPMGNLGNLGTPFYHNGVHTRDSECPPIHETFCTMKTYCNFQIPYNNKNKIFELRIKFHFTTVNTQFSTQLQYILTFPRIWLLCNLRGEYTLDYWEFCQWSHIWKKITISQHCWWHYSDHCIPLSSTVIAVKLPGILWIIASSCLLHHMDMDVCLCMFIIVSYFLLNFPWAIL
jgi:hypothetical protein